MSKETEIKELPDLIKILKEDIGKLLGANISICIVNSDAEIKYIDKNISKFSDFIISFTKGNFEILSIGDHSLPLSGTNIAFFKVSEKSLVILNSDKGPVGQLLAFKGRMNRYSSIIDDLLESIPEKGEEKAPVKAAVRVPVLTVDIASKKFGMEEAKVLHLVNGENTISDICDKTKLPQLKVDEILRKYQKKGWVKLKRLIVGLPKEGPKRPVEKPVITTPAAVPTTPTPAPQIASSKGESIYLFPILEDAFESKKFPKADRPILELCNGQYTINDIVDASGLNKLKVMEILKKYEKKGKLTITKILPTTPTIKEPITPSTSPTAVPTSTYSAVPEVPPTQPVTSVPPSIPSAAESEDEIFDDLMQIMEETQPIQEPGVGTAPGSPSLQIPPMDNPAPSIYQPASVVSSPPPAPTTPPTTPITTAPPAIQTPEPPMSEIQGEPVAESLFDDLKNLLDETSPVVPPQETAPVPPQSPIESTAPSIPQPPAEPTSPRIPVAPTQPASDQKPISSNSLLEPGEEGIKITTYPEEDPLQNRLERLSNILDESIEDTISHDEKAGVKIIGSKAVCPNCKTHVIMMAKICPNCQKPLRLCPNCKSPITLFARICPSCGSLL